jgi:acetyl-CoA carboxylase carboxyl transferase subunit alpha
MTNINKTIDCIEDLKQLSLTKGVDVDDELEAIRKKINRAVNIPEAWQLVKTARDPLRFRSQDLIKGVFDDFIELHGDRRYGDDRAIIGGIAFLEGLPVTIIANAKGFNLKDTISRNAGMGCPEGYRKALRLARQAEKFGRPVITFVDTLGAYPSLESERRGIAEAIATNLKDFTNLNTPIVCIVVGEGGSGGALGLCVGDRVFMLENSYFSVITPEGFAAQVLHDESQRKQAATLMKITPQDMLDAGFCDGIISEHECGKKLSVPEICSRIKGILVSEIDVLLKEDRLLDSRNERYDSF